MSCFRVSINTIKNFKPKFVREKPPQGHALFSQFLIQAKITKMAFSGFFLSFFGIGTIFLKYKP